MYFCLFQISVKLQAVFIDTFYNTANPKEMSKFKDYTNKLIKFADEVKPFECKDIKIALTELMEAQKKIDDLNDQMNQLKEEAKEKNSEICILWNVCFNVPQIGGLGTVLFVVGGILSVMIVCCCQKWCLSCFPCCVPGNNFLFDKYWQVLASTDMYRQVLASTSKYCQVQGVRVPFLTL